MRRSIIVSSLVVTLGVGIAAGFPSPEPTGVEKAKFGTSLDEVKKAYPTMELTTAQTEAPAFNHPKLTRYMVRKQKVAGFPKPMDLELRFWDGKFWIGVYYFGENDYAKSLETFQQRLGKPTYDKDEFLSWAGTTLGATANKKAGWLELHDEGLSNLARQELFKGLLATGDVITPAAQGTPKPPAPTLGGTATPAAAPAK
jgi:hypothetical protein